MAEVSWRWTRGRMRAQHDGNVDYFRIEENPQTQKHEGPVGYGRVYTERPATEAEVLELRLLGWIEPVR